MRLSRLLIVTLLLAFAVLPTTYAQSSGSPYSVTLPVTDVSQGQRDQVFTTALTQVLARVAGGQDLRSNDGYAAALGNASSLVKKFQYKKVDGGLALEVDFEPGAVQHLVSTLGVAPAGVKPPVLLLIRGSDGKLFGQDALGALAAAAASQGTSVAYPDPSDTPDVAKVAAADPAALAAIDQHYHTGLVLLGSLHNGKAEWTLVSGGQTQRWSSQGDTEDALLSQGAAGMLSRLGKKLNVIGAGVTHGTLWVSGLHSALDYASLLADLHADPSVQEVDTVAAQNDGVLLDVQASEPIDALAVNLAAGGHLLLQNASHDGADANLRWLH